MYLAKISLATIRNSGLREILTRLNTFNRISFGRRAPAPYLLPMTVEYAIQHVHSEQTFIMIDMGSSNTEKVLRSLDGESGRVGLSFVLSGINHLTR